VSVSLKECDKTDPAQLGWEYDSADKLFKKYGKCLQRSAGNNAVLSPCNASSPAQSVAMAPSGVKDSNQWVTISEAEEGLCLQTGAANWGHWDQILAARKAKADGVATDGVVAPVQFATCVAGGGQQQSVCAQGDDGGYSCQIFGGVEPGGGTVEDLAPGVGGGGMVHRPDVWYGVGNYGKFPEPIKLCLSADTSIGKCVPNCPAGQTWQPSTDAGAYVVAEQCDSSSPAQGGWDWVGQTATGAPITAGGGDAPGVKGVIKKDGACLQWDSGGNIPSALIRPCDGSDAQVMTTTWYTGPTTAPWDTIKDSEGRCLQAFAHDAPATAAAAAAGARHGSTLGAVQFVPCGSTPTFSPSRETQPGQLFGTGSSTAGFGAGPGMITAQGTLCLSAQVGGKCAANTCTCSNGTPATGAACTTNNAVKCAKCAIGYTLNTSNNTCVANTCTCSNGTPATGAACTTNNAVKCASCTAGYTLNGTTCTPNNCTCPNGTPATGAACTTNNAVKCASCTAGYTLQLNVQNAQLDIPSIHPIIPALQTLAPVLMAHPPLVPLALRTMQLNAQNAQLDFTLLEIAVWQIPNAAPIRAPPGDNINQIINK